VWAIQSGWRLILKIERGRHLDGPQSRAMTP
jgi:hypothetical protein